MSSEMAIRVRDVSKRYFLYDHPEDRLKQSIVPRLERMVGRPPRQYYREFAALDRVSFEVGRGETVGIVGRNGSGKSTLLQIICGTLQPSLGTVEVKGRIAALLELGAGFNPDFTGRENAYLNGAILGLTRAELDARFDGIAAFADIGPFIDQQVKTYSSGMYVRLAFAVAISVDPNILVVDEALSVGDEAFQRKCFARIEQIKERGATILFVTHAAQTIVQLCSRALLIDAGELLIDGRPKTVVSQYQRLVHLSIQDARQVREQIKTMDGWAKHGENEAPAPSANGRDATASIGDDHDEDSASLEAFDPSFVTQSRVDYEKLGAEIVDLRITNRGGKQVNILERRRRYFFEYKVKYARDASGIAFGMLIKTINGIELAGTGTNLVFEEHYNVRAGQDVLVRMGFDCNLAPGTYFLNCGAGASEGDGRIMLHRILDGLTFRVVDGGKQIYSGHVDLNIVPEIKMLGDAETGLN